MDDSEIVVLILNVAMTVVGLLWLMMILMCVRELFDEM